jgi:YegS/Rv2252/BmrU family lipid kinase
MREIVMVFNPAAGRRRRRRLQQVLAVLDERRVRYQVRETSTAGDARRIAANLPQNTAMVVAVGGDGTVNEVVNGLVGAADAGRRPELALVPMGTANVLAAEIGLTDLSPENISGTIIDGQRRDIFLARANERYLIQMCGVGFDAHVVANVNLSLKRRVGKLAYALASLAQFWRYIPRKYRVVVDGVTYDAASVIVANGHFYAGRFSCAPQARIDEPLLHACLFQRTGRWHVIRYAWGLLSGRLGHFRDVMVVPAEQVVIDSAAAPATAEPVQGDGDIIADLPVTITAGAARLTLRCPA